MNTKGVEQKKHGLGPAVQPRNQDLTFFKASLQHCSVFEQPHDMAFIIAYAGFEFLEAFENAMNGLDAL